MWLCSITLWLPRGRQFATFSFEKSFVININTVVMAKPSREKAKMERKPQQIFDEDEAGAAGDEDAAFDKVTGGSKSVV